MTDIHPETPGHNLVADPSFARRLIGPPGSSSEHGDFGRAFCRKATGR